MNNLSVMMARTAICPECERTFKDLRGLNGHLRFKHDFDSERVDELMDEAREEIAHRKSIEADTIEEPPNPLMLALDRVVRSRARKEVAEELHRRWKGKDRRGERGEIGFLTETIPERKVAKEYVKRCEEEIEEAKEALDTVLQREAASRE